MNKTKKLTDTKVSDNGVLEQPTLEQEKESLVNQYNEAINKREQHLASAKREEKLSDQCLGALKIIEKFIKDRDAKIRKDE